MRLSLCSASGDGIAALLLYLRDRTGHVPPAYFSWTEGNPVLYMIRYVLSGHGDVAPITREVLVWHSTTPRAGRASTLYQMRPESARYSGRALPTQEVLFII
jgi:hypothetical protein